MTFTERCQLDHLPTEILHRIIALGTCLDALALSCVNKTLRTLVANPLVFQHIVESGNDIHEHHNETREDQSGIWWSKRVIGHERDWQTSAKWALADQKVKEACFKKEEVFDNTTTMLSYLPELLSQGHDFAMKVAAQQEMLAENGQTNAFWSRQLGNVDHEQVQSAHLEKLSRATFVYAYCCTLLPMAAKEVTSMNPNVNPRSNQHRLSWYLPAALEGPLSAFFSDQQLSQDLWNSHTFLLSAPTDIPDQDDTEFELSWLRCNTLCIMMAGILHRRLEIVINRNIFGHRASTGEPQLNMNPPLATAIPLNLAFPRTPPPFTIGDFSSEALPFIARHIPAMTSTEFLTDGEWIGYYNYAHPQSVPTWDAIMHGMFFEIVADHPGFKEVQSKGKDAIGPFTLQGTIDAANGRVRLVKTYVHSGNSWKWSAFITPFGIIGAWGGTWGGWFWIWKKAWSQPGSL